MVEKRHDPCKYWSPILDPQAEKGPIVSQTLCILIDQNGLLQDYLHMEDKCISKAIFSLFLAPILFHRGGALDLAISLTYSLTPLLTEKFALAV